MLSPKIQHQLHVRRFTNNIYAQNIYKHQQHHQVVQQLHVILTIQVKEKIHYIMRNIIFYTHQSFIHLCLFITNHSLNNFKVGIPIISIHQQHVPKQHQQQIIMNSLIIQQPQLRSSSILHKNITYPHI